MRITGGTLRGRTLRAPDGMGTRPTADRVREALFNILAHHDWGDELRNPLIGANILDAFAGTGALGIEAISRGANSCTFFEKDRKALLCLRENVALAKLDEVAAIMPVDVTKPPKAKVAASLVFLDPPYHKGLIESAVLALTAQGWVAPKALLVCETAKDETLSLPPTCTALLSRHYGTTTITVYGSATG